MQLVFARHGESTANLTRTFANRTDRFPLTAAGLAQAKMLAARCGPLGFERLFTSPLLRARQTAAEVGGATGLIPEVREGLSEFDVGSWEGSSAEEGWAEYGRVTAAWAAGDPSAATPGGESLDDIRARFSLLAQELANLANAGHPVLCIGHGGLYRAALPSFLVNVSHAFAHSVDFPTTGLVSAEVRAGSMVCTAWCGRPPTAI